MSEKPPITVLGSINTDLVLRVPHIPLPGETLLGADMAVLQGGKGANQAVAASRVGGAVTMIGCLGDDGYGDVAVRTLATEGLAVTHVRRVAGVPSGVAVVALAASGENSIIVSPGANAQVSADDVAQGLRDAAAGGVAIAQLEVPIETVRAFLTLARERGMMTLLNPAPAQREALNLLALVDVLICNETEAALLTGQEVRSREDADVAARLLARHGPRSVLVTLGGDGVVGVGAGAGFQVPAFAVPVVDTTGAGDTFVGTCGVRLAMGDSLADAVRYASAAAALSVGILGAREGMPTAEQVATFLAATPATR
jgi:ribokinase